MLTLASIRKLPLWSLATTCWVDNSRSCLRIRRFFLPSVSLLLFSLSTHFLSHRPLSPQPMLRVPLKPATVQMQPATPTSLFLAAPHTLPQILLVEGGLHGEMVGEGGWGGQGICKMNTGKLHRVPEIKFTSADSVALRQAVWAKPRHSALG